MRAAANWGRRWARGWRWGHSEFPRWKRALLAASEWSSLIASASLGGKVIARLPAHKAELCGGDAAALGSAAANQA